MSRQRTPISVDADKALTPRQQEILDHVLTTGESPLVASESLGTHVRNIYRTLAYPHVKKELQRRVLDHVGLLSAYAAKTQEELLLSDSDHVRATVAENILDRHLGKPVMRQQIAMQGQIHAVIDLS